jgi:hypothetical protein
VLKLPPGDRIKAFEKMDFVTFAPVRARRGAAVGGAGAGPHGVVARVGAGSAYSLAGAIVLIAGGADWSSTTARARCSTRAG